MITAKAAHRYAEAIFPLAKEQNNIDEIMQDFNLIHRAITSSADLRILVTSPVISQQNKKNIFHDIFKNKISNLTFDLLNLMIEKNRENLILDVCSRFEVLYNKEKNLLPIIIKSANELPEEIKKSIIAKVESISGKKILPSYKIDSSIISGVIIQINDWVYDVSLARKLEIIHKRLIS